MRKVKITSLMISAFMITSLISVMAAAPASAQEVLGVEFQTEGEATVAWTIEQQHAGDCSVHLETTVEFTPGPGKGFGNEARIVIPMPEGTTLGNIETILWWVKTVVGYPPHVDVILADDIDGVMNIDSLTAEVASNSNPEDLPWTHPTEPNLQSSYDYGTWLRTFETSDGIGVSEIDGDTTFWVTRHGAGTADAPYGTLAELKAGTVHYPVPWDPDITITINEDIVVLRLRLEIEVDDWITQSEAYIDEITINGEPYDLEMRAGITLTPDEGFATTTVAGENFNPTSVITVKWGDTAQPTVPTTVETNDDGNFTAIISVPTTTPGGNTITATDEFGNSASADFKVISMKGDTGKDGAQGTPGSPGSTGSTGSKGDKGDTGATGSKGDTGSAGPKGDTGSAGPQGPAGVDVSTGAALASIIMSVIALIAALYIVTTKR